ncbi:MAG: hypothetical protein J0H81_04360 [Sphingopyxis terrae]|nr:hypothetical protein [Sphingopyxis terrae]
MNRRDSKIAQDDRIAPVSHDEGRDQLVEDLHSQQRRGEQSLAEQQQQHRQDQDRGIDAEQYAPRRTRRPP